MKDAVHVTDRINKQYAQLSSSSTNQLCALFRSLLIGQ